MRFQDFYNASHALRFSIEVFPPKTQEGFAALFQELQQLKSSDPAFVSVTYGAMGSTRNLTEDLAVLIHHQLQIPTAFHFTCVGAGRAEIAKYVQHLASRGLNLVVALRGDIPQGQIAFAPPADGFAHANELVSYLKSVHPFSIAVAGYPEKHKEALSLDEDLDNLKRKVDAGADVVLTQLFFDNSHYHSFVEAAQRRGIQVPIIPGIMPIQSLAQIEKITQMCGASLPNDLHEKLKTHQDDPKAVREIGIEHATRQCLDLKAHQVLGIHFYSLNKALPILRILQSLHGATPRTHTI